MNDELWIQARTLLWDAHALIREAYVSDVLSSLWDWREGPLTDFLLATGELQDVADATIDVEAEPSRALPQRAIGVTREDEA